MRSKKNKSCKAFVVDTVVNPYAHFSFPKFQLPVVNHGLKILNEENSRNKQIISF